MIYAILIFIILFQMWGIKRAYKIGYRDSNHNWGCREIRLLGGGKAIVRIKLRELQEINQLRFGYNNLDVLLDIQDIY